MRDILGSAGTTRRGFVAGGAVGMAALGASGCLAAPAFADQEENAGKGAPAYRVVAADVLIIGGGNMGAFAARAAARDGRHVLIVDKGVFHHNGVTGMGWEFGNAAVLGTVPAIATQTVFGKAYQDAVNWCNTYGDELAGVGDNFGQALPLRGEDGALENEHCQFLRHGMDAVANSPRVDVADRVFVTELVIEGGKCLGAMGIDLMGGGYVLFRANATVVATGPATAMNGWLGTHPVSIGTVEATGDVEISAFRHGLGICSADFCEYDMEMLTPASIGSTFGISINVDSREIADLYGADGEPLFEDPADPRWSIRDLFTSEVARQLFIEGRATDIGGMLVDTSQEALETGRPFNLRNAEYLKSEFGIDVTEKPLNVGFEMYERGGFIEVDDSMMSPGAEGLFGGRIYRGGGFINLNFYSGSYVGHCAAQYAAGSEGRQGEVDLSSVEAEIARLEEIRTREVADPVRPHAVRHAIQDAFYAGMGVCRYTERMEAALAELERIKAEDLPRMVPADRSMVWNKEWKEAVENYSLIEHAILTVRAALAREESRGYIIRAEFPFQDDENWDCTLVARLVDGETVFEKISPAKYDETQIVGLPF